MLNPPLRPVFSIKRQLDAMPLSKVQRGLVEVDADIVRSGAVLFIQTLASLLVSARDVMAIRNQCAVRGLIVSYKKCSAAAQERIPEAHFNVERLERRDL